MLPAIIGAGAKILGGIIDRNSSDAWRSEALAREQMVNNEELSREFAQHGVRWRVEDAKAAGLHPVYALGASGASFSSPAFSLSGESSRLGQSIADAGQDISRAVMAQETDFQRKERELRLELLRSQIDENDARTWGVYSQIARDEQARSSAAPFPPNVSVPDQFQMVPTEIPSPSRSDSSTVAGPANASWRKFEVAPGREWWMPNAQSFGESLENVSESLPILGMVLMENMRRNPNFIMENRSLWPGGETIGDIGSWLNGLIQRAINAGKGGNHSWNRLHNRRMR